jgi:two-component system, cell cycle response regulator DivK
MTQGPAGVAHVLVIEDARLNLELVTALLEVEGFTVSVAMTAAEGIHLAQRDRPDLILMDLNLPDMDGVEATRRLKADPDTRRIPVVALTADAMRGTEQRVLAAGCVACMTKPIDTRAFGRTIRSFLPARPPAVEEGP